jgi:hypothetical protein
VRPIAIISATAARVDNKLYHTLPLVASSFGLENLITTVAGNTSKA